MEKRFDFEESPEGTSLTVELTGCTFQYFKVTAEEEGLETFLCEDRHPDLTPQSSPSEKIRGSITN